VLCGLPGLSTDVMSAPVAASATIHFGARAAGRAYSVFPSGESAIRIGAAPFVALLPHEIVGVQIVGGQTAARRDVEPGRLRVRRDALIASCPFPRPRPVAAGSGGGTGAPCSGTRLTNLCPVIDVEDENAGAAVAHVVAAADARQRRVQEALRPAAPALASREWPPRQGSGRTGKLGELVMADLLAIRFSVDAAVTPHSMPGLNRRPRGSAVVHFASSWALAARPASGAIVRGSGTYASRVVHHV